MNMEVTERASDAYNRASKADLLAWCKRHGVEVFETDTLLVEDWADRFLGAFDAAEETAKREIEAT